MNGLLIVAAVLLAVVALFWGVPLILAFLSFVAGVLQS